MSILDKTMMRSTYFLVFYLLHSFCLNAKSIPNIENRHHDKQDFHSLDTLYHAATGIQFELGYFSPKGYYISYDSKSSKTAQAYLKSTNESTGSEFIPLQLFDDLDLLQFTSLSSDNLILYQNRYTFGIYDVNTQNASSSQQPGAYKYEGEDAISSLLSGFSFFDHEKFLFGHIQAYGIFCYDISNSIHPIELRRYALSQNNEGVYYDNQGEYHAFLYPSDGGRWDVLLARSDTSIQSLTGVYAGFTEIKYAKKDVFITLDDKAEPKVVIDANGVVQVQLIGGAFLAIDLNRGTAIHVEMNDLRNLNF